ncbi:MAG TPA: sigma-54 dependent transcriptional regulator [Myxococcaceae bacterium]|nr:sigma-54 dependent transcriptional regulator [Myxococcaceae bacterium]
MSLAHPRILVADDQPDVVEALRLLLKANGFAVVPTSSPAGVLGAVETEDVDVVLMDLNYTRDTTSGREGLELLARLQQLDPQLPVVVMTAWGSVEGAVDAIRGGARDYVTKPWDNTRLVTTLRSQVELGDALRRSRRLSAENERLQTRVPGMVAESRAMKAVLELVDRIAPSDANVLITGEHGTGKEVVARRIHAVSHRAGKPFVPVNAGALSEGVFESELFGHVKGAFTDAKADRTGCFELADQGTLFMDEVANMPLGQQAKLLRVLQTGEFHPVGSSRVRRADTRVLAATNADLHAGVKSGAFREDLLYRLNTVEVVLPPLRDRREDIPALASAFLVAQAARYRKPVQRFGASALKALLEYPWPGNVRELEHCVERAVLMARGSELTPEDLVLRPRDGGARVEDMTLEDAERYLIQRALGRTDGSVSDAARLLGLSRSALYRRLQQYGLKAS